MIPLQRPSIFGNKLLNMIFVGLAICCKDAF